MCSYANFFPPYFSCPFCRFSIFVFVAFSFVFSTLSRKWRRTLFVLELRHLFFRYSVDLVKEVVKLLKKSERWENKWSKVKTLQDKPRSRWPVFFYKLCEKCYRKSCKYMRNNSTRLKGKKKLQLNNIKVSSTTVMWPTKVGKPWREKRRCTLHAGMASEEFANFIPKDDRPANSRDANPLVTIWIIVDETTYKDPAPKTLD